MGQVPQSHYSIVRLEVAFRGPLEFQTFPVCGTFIVVVQSQRPPFDSYQLCSREYKRKHDLKAHEKRRHNARKITLRSRYDPLQVKHSPKRSFGLQRTHFKSAELDHGQLNTSPLNYASCQPLSWGRYAFQEDSYTLDISHTSKPFMSPISSGKWQGIKENGRKESFSPGVELLSLVGDTSFENNRGGPANIKQQTPRELEENYTIASAHAPRRGPRLPSLSALFQWTSFRPFDPLPLGRYQGSYVGDSYTHSLGSSMSPETYLNYPRQPEYPMNHLLNHIPR
jgi:hypothetical protein